MLDYNICHILYYNLTPSPTVTHYNGIIVTTYKTLIGLHIMTTMLLTSKTMLISSWKV